MVGTAASDAATYKEETLYRDLTMLYIVAAVLVDTGRGG
jgi:hypothetical protein